MQLIFKKLGCRLSANWRRSIFPSTSDTPELAELYSGEFIVSKFEAGGVAISTLVSLAANRSLVLNTVSGSLHHRIQRALPPWNFTLMTGFVRLCLFGYSQSSAQIQDPKIVRAQLPASVSIESLGSGTLSKQSTTIVRNLQRTMHWALPHFHTASFGWSHTLAPSLRLSVSAGPGWSNPGTKSGPWRTTAQGSVQVARETRITEESLLRLTRKRCFLPGSNRQRFQ